jgi:hypothetical protein
MTQRLALLAATGSMCAVIGCHRSTTESAAPVPEAAVEDAPDAEQAFAPTRCRQTDLAMALGDGLGAGDLEIGDALSYPGGVAVGIVHPTSAGRTAAVVLLGGDVAVPGAGASRVSSQLGKNVKILDLGPTLGDAPPPRIGWRAPELVAASYVRQRDGGEATRDTALVAIAADAAAGPPVVISQQQDDSLAFDLALVGSSGLLAWDEATSGSRGVVRAAAFSKDHAAPARDISPPDSDAELPRVVALGTNFAVIWIASRPEPASCVDASGPEATGEVRSYGWLEMVAVDVHGAPIGPVRSLTQPSGHVSAFDVEARPADGPPLLVVVARDDGEVVDGSGGALLRVRVKGDVVESPVAFANDGLGRGAPTFVSPSAASPSAPFAVVWVGKEEQVRFLPLDGSGAPASKISVEEAMNDARPLLFLEGPAPDAAGPRSMVLVATPTDATAQLRAFACGQLP